MATENLDPSPQIEEQPGPQISGDKGGEPSGQAGGTTVDFNALFENPKFEEYLDKKVQSVKDRRIGKHETRLDEIEATIAQYNSLRESGLSDEAAKNTIRKDRDFEEMKSFVEELKSGNATNRSVGTESKSWVESERTILESVGVDRNDSRLIEFWKNNKFSNHDAYVSALEEKAFEWRNQNINKPKPGPTTVAQTVPSVPAGSGKYDKEKYKTDMLAARGKPEELRRIKAAAKADGVDVDNIGFI